MAEATCPRCQTQFETKRHNQRFCSSACAVAHNRADTKAKRRAAALPLTNVECAGCEQVYLPLSRSQKWCSSACGKRIQMRRRKNFKGPSSVTRPCRYCGEPYTSVDGRQYYCSEACTLTAKSLREAYRRYGITMQEFRRIWLKQGGVCAICHQPERTARNRLLTIDHDHVGGHVRGLLCSQCNRAIGLLNDDPAVIRAAADYVQKTRQLRLAI